jgi:hypothetical protein
MHWTEFVDPERIKRIIDVLTGPPVCRTYQDFLTGPPGVSNVSGEEREYVGVGLRLVVAVRNLGGGWEWIAKRATFLL